MSRFGERTTYAQILVLILMGLHFALGQARAWRRPHSFPAPLWAAQT